MTGLLRLISGSIRFRLNDLFGLAVVLVERSVRVYETSLHEKRMRFLRQTRMLFSDFLECFQGRFQFFIAQGRTSVKAPFARTKLSIPPNRL